MKPEENLPPQRIGFAGFTGEVLGGQKPDAILAFLGPDPMKPAAGFVKDKGDKGSRVFCAAADFGQGPREVFIKTYDRPALLRLLFFRMFSKKGIAKPWHYPAKIVRTCFETGPSRLSARAAKVCREAGIPVAGPVLFLERGFGPFRREVMVSLGAGPRKEPNAFLHFNRHFAGKLSPAQVREKREAIRRLGQLLAAVRQSGVRFPDFKLTNLVLTGEDGGPRFVIIDLSEAHTGRFDYPESAFLERFSPHVLKSPAFSRRDRARLIKAYLEAANDPRGVAEVCAGIRRRAASQGRHPAGPEKKERP